MRLKFPVPHARTRLPFPYPPPANFVEREVGNINYDPTQPLSAAWKAIDNLQKLSIAARLKYSYERPVELAII